MKVNITCLDCEITVEEVDGKCVVTALQDGEEVESFAVDCNEAPESDDVEEIDAEEIDDDGDDDDDYDQEEMVGESIKTFDDFFVTEDNHEDEEDDDQDDDEEDDD